MALLAPLPKLGTATGDRLLRARSRRRRRGTAASSIRTNAESSGPVRPGPAGNCSTMGITLVPSDSGSVSPGLIAAGPAEGRDVQGHAGVAAGTRRTAADPVRRRGPPLDRRFYTGVPGTVSRRGPTRPGPHSAYLPTRVSDPLARAGPPNQFGPEPPYAATGFRADQ